MKSIFLNIAAASAAALLLAGCGEAKFKVSGEVDGAEGKYVKLEKSDYSGRWVVLDSAEVSGDGEFSISSPAPESPEIYRLSLNDRYIYLPVDSVEQLTVTTSASGFGSEFDVKGSENAVNLASFEKELMKADHSDPAAVEAFKRGVYTKYIQNAHGSIVSYYLLTKTVNGRPLFDPQNPDDAKYYAAVATQFDLYRPKDPHRKMLHDAAIQAQRNRASSQGRKTVMHAQQLKVLEIELPDASNVKRRLSDVVGKGKPVVVIFSLMNHPDSPAINRELARIYNSKGGGVEFYQVSLDQDHYLWRDAAVNLPWINVNDPGGPSNAAIDYNVTEIPSFYIYDASGELVSSTKNIADLTRMI